MYLPLLVLFIQSLISFSGWKILKFISPQYQYSRRQFKILQLSSIVTAIVIFTTSLALYLLLTLEILSDSTDINSKNQRWNLWKINMFFLLLSVSVVSPILQFYSLSTDFFNSSGIQDSSRQNILIRNLPGYKDGSIIHVSAMLLFTCYCYAFYKVGQIFPTNSNGASSSQNNQFDFTNLEFYLSRIGVIGVAVIASLSGFGSIYNSYSAITYFTSSVSLRDIKITQKRIRQIIDIVLIKKKRLLNIKKQLSQAPEQQSQSYWGIGSWFGGNQNYRLQSLNEELKNLVYETQSLEQSILPPLRSHLDDLLYSHERQMVINQFTFRNKEMRWTYIRYQFENVLGVIFTAYCFYKVFTCTLNIILDRHGSNNDPISHWTSIILSHWNQNANQNDKVDVEAWAQWFSFVFVGIIIIGTIRSLFIQLAKFFKAFARYIKFVNIILFLSFVLGVYFLSSILLLRASLPLKFRYIITQSYDIPTDLTQKVNDFSSSSIEFSFYQRWFDVLFVGSAVISGTILWILRAKESSLQDSDLPLE